MPQNIEIHADIQIGSQRIGSTTHHEPWSLLCIATVFLNLWHKMEICG
jgi:hypothetical protein